MEYAKIVVKTINTNKKIACSIVMPREMANLVYLRQFVSPSHEIMRGFSKAELVPCSEEEFNADNFSLYIRFQNGDISEEEYYDGLK